MKTLKELAKEQKNINAIISGIPVSPTLERNFPPSAAIIVPNWLYANQEINIDEKKHKTIKAPKPSNALNNKDIKSLSFLILPAATP